MFSLLSSPIQVVLICEASLIRAVILAHTANTIRVAIQGEDDLADLHLVGDRWLLEYPSDLPDKRDGAMAPNLQAVTYQVACSS